MHILFSLQPKIAALNAHLQRSQSRFAAVELGERKLTLWPNKQCGEFNNFRGALDDVAFLKMKDTLQVLMLTDASAIFSRSLSRQSVTQRGSTSETKIPFLISLRQRWRSSERRRLCDITRKYGLWGKLPTWLLVAPGAAAFAAAGAVAVRFAPAMVATVRAWIAVVSSLKPRFEAFSTPYQMSLAVEHALCKRWCNCWPRPNSFGVALKRLKPGI